MLQVRLPNSSCASKRSLIPVLLPLTLILLLATGAAPSRYQAELSFSQEEAVTWTQTWGAVASGASLSKVGPIGWTSGASSTKALVAGDGHLEFTAGAAAEVICGLARDAAPQAYESFDFAIQLGGKGDVSVIESGVSTRLKRSYAAGDRLRVAIEGSGVRFYNNGALLYTSTKPVRYPLSAVTSLYSAASSVEDAVLSGTLVENVAWTSGRNVSASGNGLWKSSGVDSRWDAGAVSTRAIASDGYVEFTATEVSGHRALGLSHGDTDQSRQDIDFALALDGDGVVWVLEGGAPSAANTYLPGDRFQVAVEAGAVKYRKNGELFRTGTLAPVLPLLVDTSINRLSDGFRGVVLAGDLVDVAVGPPVFSVPSGHYAGPQTVLVTADAAATVPYTTSGAEPTEADPVIEPGTPLAIDKDTVLKARAWAPGLLPSGVAVGTYTFGTWRSEPVSWTSSPNLTTSASDLTKVGGTDGAWDTGAASTRAIASMDGYVEFVSAASPGRRMLGLSHGDHDPSEEDIDFAVSLDGDAVRVIESGIYRGRFGTYVAGDRFRVAVEGGAIRYRKNGRLFYTSTVAPTFPLSVDTSIGGLGIGFKGVTIAGKLVNTPPSPRTGGDAASLVVTDEARRRSQSP